jgi:hypothetical protein
MVSWHFHARLWDLCSASWPCSAKRTGLMSPWCPVSISSLPYHTVTPTPSSVCGNQAATSNHPFSWSLVSIASASDHFRSCLPLTPSSWLPGTCLLLPFSFPHRPFPLGFMASAPSFLTMEMTACPRAHSWLFPGDLSRTSQVLDGWKIPGDYIKLLWAMQLSPLDLGLWHQSYSRQPSEHLSAPCLRRSTKMAPWLPVSRAVHCENTRVSGPHTDCSKQSEIILFQKLVNWNAHSQHAVLFQTIMFAAIKIYLSVNVTSFFSHFKSLIIVSQTELFIILKTT